MSHSSVSPRRTGMVLLIVMALLAMVGLTAVTFLLTTGQLKDAANLNRRTGEITVNPEAMLQDAIMMIIRGTENTKSPLYGHSLLEDMYGTTDEYASPSEEFTGTFGSSDGMVTISGGAAKYAGCVITCVDDTSPAYRRSTVVLKFQDQKMYCVPFPDGETFSGKSAKFIVNTLPFQQSLHDYDAVDDNNKFLAGRDPSTSRVTTYSFRQSNVNIGSEVDADNDGYKDSYWLDFGMPIFTYKNGARFKPLFGVVIEDMDGKLNVNAAGNWPESTASSSDRYGMGRGPAEIAWERVFEELSGSGSTVAQNLFNARMAAQGKNVLSGAASQTPDHIPTSDVRGPWYKDFSTTASLNQNGVTSGNINIQRVPHDVLGKWHISVSDGEPSFSEKTTTGQGELGGSRGNTYDRDLGQSHAAGINFADSSTGSSRTGMDMLFAPSEMEALLRLYDFDAPFLPQRLKYLATNQDGASTQNLYKLAHQITTESWDLPIAKKLSTLSNSESVLPEVVAGWQIDLLRAAAFNINDDPWDDTKHCYPKRQQFMQSVYEILRDQNLDPGGSGDSVEKRRAQWAANIVDFMDVDNAMTPFKPMGADFTVFGCEQPELLITETLAMHSRNTEANAVADDLQVGGYGFNESGKPVKGPQSETDTNIYENYKIPFSKSKYPVLNENGTVQKDENGKQIEVTQATENTIKNKLSKLQGKGWEPDGTNDWDQYFRPQGALFVQLYSPLSGASSPNVENDIYESGSHKIDLAKLSGDNPVWRLVVTDNYTIGDSEHNLKRDTATWPQTGNSGDCFAYHVRMVVSFHTEGGVKPAPDLTSSSNDNYFTFYPEQNASIEPQGTLLIGPANETVFRFNPDAEAGKGAAAVQKSITLRGTTFSSKGGLGSGAGMAIKPLHSESPRLYARFSLTEPRKSVGDSSDYYGPDTSLEQNTPQLSVESPLDIEVDPDWGIFSNVKNRAQILKTFGTSTDNRCIVHLQRLANPSKSWDNNYNPYITVDSMIVDLTVMNARIGATEMEKDENQQFVTSGRNPTEVYSQQRKAAFLWEQNSKTNEAVSTSAPKFGQIPTGSRSWLGWTNTVPTSPFQLMNVTNRCSSELMYHYTGAGDGNTNRLGNTYGYLPDFSGTLRKAIGFFRVPTPQLVTPMVLNPYYRTQGSSVTKDLPGAYYTMYREPGKINLNTAGNPVLKALLDTNAEITRSQTTFRSIIQAPEESILKSSTFQIHTTQTAEDASTGTNPSERLDFYRYANLATTRSNVFAVWLTMGFFEVNENNNLTGNELGEEMGEMRRYRAFYMIDRTIPVGFERGKNHNADQVIILKRMLQ